MSKKKKPTTLNELKWYRHYGWHNGLRVYGEHAFFPTAHPVYLVHEDGRLAGELDKKIARSIAVEWWEVEHEAMRLRMADEEMAAEEAALKRRS